MPGEEMRSTQTTTIGRTLSILYHHEKKQKTRKSDRTSERVRTTDAAKDQICIVIVGQRQRSSSAGLIYRRTLCGWANDKCQQLAVGGYARYATYDIITVEHGHWGQIFFFSVFLC